MSKTVTLRMDERLYKRFRTLAKCDNRSLSNFIETAALRHIESQKGVEYCDEAEMEEIRNDKELIRSIERGWKDAQAGRGRFV